MIEKIIFEDGHTYDCNHHMALQNLSEQNIKDIMELVKKLSKGKV